MSDRSIRNLANLQAFGSTSRVLNLLAVWRRHGRTDEWRDKPLFQTPALNRGLIIKHRLRRDEVDLFHVYRQSATKVILPIDLDDLRLGGRFIFVGQRNFDRALREHFGVSVDERDLETLRLIDQLPSLDPFLLREQIKRAGLDVARCYFELTEGDMKRMFSFVESQIAPLVAMSMTAEASPARPAPPPTWCPRSCPTPTAPGCSPWATPSSWRPSSTPRACSAGKASSTTNGPPPRC